MIETSLNEVLVLFILWYTILVNKNIIKDRVKNLLKVKSMKIITFAYFAQIWAFVVSKICRAIYNGI